MHKSLDYLVKYLVDERSDEIRIPDNYEDKRLLLRGLMNERPPIKISPDFLKVQDEFLSYELSKMNLTSPKEIKEVKGKIMLWQGDITSLKVDAIVNAANSQMLGCFIANHNCIDNAIHSRAGLELRSECNSIMKRQGHIESVGGAKITKAYNLPSKYVIHTVGPAIPYGLKPTERDKNDLKNCYKSCLGISNEYHLKSLAFCSVSTGVFNFPKDLAAEIAVNTVNEYLTSNQSSIEYVIFNVFGRENYLIYKNLLFGD